jgi:hypothetical protein
MENILEKKSDTKSEQPLQKSFNEKAVPSFIIPDLTCKILSTYCNLSSQIKISIDR